MPKFCFKILQHSLTRMMGISPPLPYKLSLSVTNLCNCRCAMCNVWKIYHEGAGDPGQELTLAELEKIFTHYGTGLYWLAITGGEPFLRADLANVVEAALARCRNLFIVSLATNGSQPERTARMVRQLAERHQGIRFYVTVSIDSDEETHDRLRGVAGIFKKAVETVRLLDEVKRDHPNVSVMIEMLVSSLNMGPAASFLDSTLLAENDYCATFSHESERYLNEGTCAGLKRAGEPVRDALIREIRRRVRIKSLPFLLLKMYYRLFDYYYTYPRRQVLPCYACRSSVYLDALGNIRPCVMMGIVGNIRAVHYNIREVLKRDEIERVRKEIVKERCPQCWTPCEAIYTIIQNFPLAVLKTMHW